MSKDIFSLDEIADSEIVWEYQNKEDFKIWRLPRCFLTGHKPLKENFVGHGGEGGHYRCYCGFWEYVIKDETA